MPILAPSVLSADFAHLGRDIDMLNSSEADWLHIDIMDGVFVPNISFGFPVLKSIQKLAQKPLDVHLMIVQPERYVSMFAEAGSYFLSVHLEAVTHLHRVVYQIKEHGMKAGVAINPHTPVSSLSSIIADIDLVCVMSVNPGFGGQSFIPYTYQKLSELAELRYKQGSSCLLEVDGGVNDQNAKELVHCGADVLVAGNFVFSAANPLATIASLKAL